MSNGGKGESQWKRRWQVWEIDSVVIGQVTSVIWLTNHSTLVTCTLPVGRSDCTWWFKRTLQARVFTCVGGECHVCLTGHLDATMSRLKWERLSSLVPVKWQGYMQPATWCHSCAPDSRKNDAFHLLVSRMKSVSHLVLISIFYQHKNNLPLLE